MKIILTRHGRPLLDSPRRIPGREMRLWFARYNEAGIDPALPPPTHLVTLASEIPHVVCSDLRRSIESAHALAPSQPPIVDQVFREADLPTPTQRRLALGPHTWGAISRVLWLSGRNLDAEPVEVARGRARQGALLLAQAAAEHGTVLLAGHGFINILIARELRRQGWRGPRIPTRRYWDHAVYRA